MTRSAFPITARSTIIKCATNSAADHLSSLGLVLHASAGTASATHKNPVCAFDIVAITESNFCDTATFPADSSYGAAAGLLEGVRQLQNAGFAEGRPEDLQAYRQLPIDFSAGNGDAGDAR